MMFTIACFLFPVVVALNTDMGAAKGAAILSLCLIVARGVA